MVIMRTNTVVRNDSFTPHLLFIASWHTIKQSAARLLVIIDLYKTSVKLFVIFIHFTPGNLFIFLNVLF